MPVAAASNAIISLAEVKDFLGISTGTTDDDDFLQTWINRHSLAIEGFAGFNNKVKVQDVANEITNGTGRTKHRTLYYPIYAIGIAASTTDAAKLASVQYWNTTTLAWTNIETDLTRILLNNPELSQVSGQKSYNIELTVEIFPEGTQNIRLNYQTGWSTIPADFVTMCLEKTGKTWKDSPGKGRGGWFGMSQKSQSEGGGSKSTTYIDFTERHAKMMKPYLRRY
jgi:hypothetical protein